jgi:tetratricopeptide (TPR) repeat protein
MAFAAASMHEATEARRLQGGDDAAASRALGFLQANSLMGAFWIADWAEVVRQGEGLIAAKNAMRAPDQADDFLLRRVYPPLATALVHLGRLDEARALQAQMPEACDFCRQTRAGSLELMGDHAGAERAWDEMIRHNPKYVFPYNWRAYYRLQRGDFDGAIAATEKTNKLGPNWADPLEIWAEALAGKGDFTGAAAKYREASQFAPRWGRLHLKWGEALTKQGKPADARAQFQAAGTMDLGPADKAELAAQKA